MKIVRVYVYAYLNEKKKQQKTLILFVSVMYKAENKKIRGFPISWQKN